MTFVATRSGAPRRRTGRARCAGPRAQAGQAYAEYIVLLSCTVFGFLLFFRFAWTEEALITALKSFFQAYSYSLSLP